MSFHIIILAAGKGKRMQSALPKVLHCIAGKPLLQHVIETAQQLMPEAIHVVVGHQQEKVMAQLSGLAVNWVSQQQPLGTADAVKKALPGIPQNARVLILFGDVPLISAAALERLLHTAGNNTLGIITAIFAEPKGLGRIIRDTTGAITQIVEHNDAPSEIRAINEINSGIMLVSAQDLTRWLPQIAPYNSQQEYYLTDIIALAAAEGVNITSILAEEYEVTGINDRAQLAFAERLYQQQQAQQLLAMGVTLRDPLRIDIRGTVNGKPDVVIDVNVILEGNVFLGENAYIGPNCYLKNAIIGKSVSIYANSIIDGATIEDNCTVGPFARVRPGTWVKAKAHIGNFVEVKNTSLGENSKVGHLSYLGDTEIGNHVNIGAGTITCNYDGANKHKTVIEDGVFVGSGTELIAPIIVRKGAIIGAGSTLTKEVPERALTLTRAERKSIKNWKRPEKNESK